MTLIRTLALTCLLSAPCGAARADVVENVISQLRAEGFESISISRTFLGRARIVGRDGSREREIVLDRRTGEVLRDWREDHDDDGDDRDDDDRRRDRDDDDRGRDDDDRDDNDNDNDSGDDGDDDD